MIKPLRGLDENYTIIKKDKPHSEETKLVTFPKALLRPDGAKWQLEQSGGRKVALRRCSSATSPAKEGKSP